jgi:hypothetical protein
MKRPGAHRRAFFIFDVEMRAADMAPAACRRRFARREAALRWRTVPSRIDYGFFGGRSGPECTAAADSHGTDHPARSRCDLRSVRLPAFLTSACSHAGWRPVPRLRLDSSHRARGLGRCDASERFCFSERGTRRSRVAIRRGGPIPSHKKRAKRARRGGLAGTARAADLPEALILPMRGCPNNPDRRAAAGYRVGARFFRAADPRIA